MLTYAQVQVVAFTTENGTVHHHSCAGQEFGELTIAKAEAGMSNTGPGLRPLIQYELDSWVGEDAWERAEERVSDFEYDHPRTAALLGLGFNGRNRDRLLDRLAERIGDAAGPSCDTCGGYVAEPPLEIEYPER